jgi:hypothetical protein
VFQKGSALKSLLRAIERKHGEDVLRAVIAGVPDDVRPDLVQPILPVRWYPIRDFASVHAVVRDLVGNGRWEVSRDIGHEAARIDFNGMYRVFIRAVHYDSLWDRIKTAWTHYNSHGESNWDTKDGGTASGRIWNVSGFNPGQWHSIAGRAEEMLIMAGAKSSHVEIIDPLPTSCRFDAMYVR